VVSSGVYNSKYTPARFDGSDNANEIFAENNAENRSQVNRSRLS